jgi:hypothetical protein
MALLNIQKFLYHYGKINIKLGYDIGIHCLNLKEKNLLMKR